MKKPILAVMAAGMGSRYGGLKQMDPVGAGGEVIMDYSLYDAKRAGFERVVFIIKSAIERDFKEKIGNRIEKYMEVSYVYQDIADLPAGYAVPAGREKPWGTAHAVLTARNVIDAPFAVINADDYYGRECFALMYRYLTEHTGDSEYCMVGYQLKNTVTENGTVARGICRTDGNGFLTDITEYTKIRKAADGISYTEDEGKTWTALDPETPVSMNLWGFPPSFMEKVRSRFPAFLDEALQKNPQKAEYYLPSVVSALIKEEKAHVQVLRTGDVWHGVTYKADRPGVVQALADMADNGLYPVPIWR